MAAAADGRSLEVLTVEVGALHAWLCAVVAAIAADRRTAGLPDLPGLPVLPGDPEDGTAAALPRPPKRRILHAV